MTADWRVGFTPCSPKHKSCSPWHANLVRGYVQERQRQEMELEELTGLHKGDLQDWKDRGGRLITFKEWLIANRSGHEHHERGSNEARNQVKTTRKSVDSTVHRVRGGTALRMERGRGRKVGARRHQIRRKSSGDSG